MLHEHRDMDRYRQQVEIVEDAVKSANELLRDQGSIVSWVDGAKDPSVNDECAILIHGGGNAGIRSTFGNAVMWLTQECIRRTDPELHAAVGEGYTPRGEML